MINKAVAKLTRENHFSNLIDNLPLFTILYGAQCVMAHFFFYEFINPGHFAVMLGGFLVAVMCSIYIYDKYNHIIVYEDKIQIFFEVFGTSKVINFDDILEIEAPDYECEFGPVSILLKNKQTVHLQFIDYPLQVKKVLLEYVQKHRKKNTEKYAA